MEQFRAMSVERLTWLMQKYALMENGVNQRILGRIMDMIFPDSISTPINHEEQLFKNYCDRLLIDALARGIVLGQGTTLELNLTELNQAMLSRFENSLRKGMLEMSEAEKEEHEALLADMKKMPTAFLETNPLYQAVKKGDFLLLFWRWYEALNVLSQLHDVDIDVLLYSDTCSEYVIASMYSRELFITTKRALTKMGDDQYPLICSQIFGEEFDALDESAKQAFIQSKFSTLAAEVEVYIHAAILAESNRLCLKTEQM